MLLILTLIISSLHGMKSLFTILNYRDMCIMLKDRGLLAKPTHDHIIRLAPPLVISEEELEACLRIMKEVLEEMSQKN